MRRDLLRPVGLQALLWSLAVIEFIGLCVIVSLLAMFAPPLIAGVVTGLAWLFKGGGK